ncbi:TonB-dependent receptor [Gluconacetobacter azotocaptans]|uniref:TonB-dependent receptor n=1 Tax=Gluconacetobacter azotocaptans TaxID=142834 RepID=UPI00195D7E54|nr:TonB-dependent receptor [Gluconacetobacter azotocaptans]MBM9401046.1 TonB-dependent receptor [Gluconacetobacter azotocaptans]
MNKRIVFCNILLATTMMSGHIDHGAMAATKDTSIGVAPKHVVRTAPAARRGTTPDSPAQARAPEEVGVVARHIARGAQVTMGQTMISQNPPGSNPLKALGNLPGVIFQSNDPQGVDTWSAQIYMHGFQQEELGVTLDGVPLGAMTYRNYNGLSPILAVSSENVERIDVSQGAGAESVAATNNLGGSLEYHSFDPSEKFGGSVLQGFGSYSAFHTFARVDSGALNHSGTRFYVSYMRNDTNRWKGAGDQFYQQLNAKFLQPIGNDSSISAYFDWGDLHQFNYQDVSPDMLKHLGWMADDYYNGHASGYIAAYKAALATQGLPGGAFPANFASLGDPADASYYDGATNEDDKLGYIKADFALTDSLRWTTTAYGHGETNQTTWATPFASSPNGAPLSEIVKQPAIQRFGVLSQATYDIAHNHIGGGIWYENNSYISPMFQYQQPLVVDGVIQGSPLYSLSHYSNPFAEVFNQNYNTNTFTAFVQDTYSPVRNLALHFGFKSLLNTTRVGDGYLNQSYYGNVGPITSGVGLTTAKAFLPHISADYHFLQHHEIYFDISENVHTYAQSGYNLSNSPFAVTQAAYNYSAASIRPETAWTYAIGYRYNDRLLAASVYAYRTNFNNRLQQITAGPALNPISAVANVGGVTMNGVDAQLTIMPIEHLALTNSISYNHAVYDSNLTTGGVTYALANKQVVNYPRFMYKARLSYDWHAISAYIDGSYVGTRNYDYTGDIKVPGYWISNLGVQYHFGNLGRYNRNFGFMKKTTLSFSINNLSNVRYISTMGENGNSMTAATGELNQSMLPGAPRMFFGSLRVDF